MPGLVGLITKHPGAGAEQELEKMLQPVRHEAFYTEGKWVDPDLGVWAAWTSRKGSFCDGMPVWNERRDHVLIFSGEEYPEPGAACRPRQGGHDTGASPAAYLVRRYEDDPGFVAGLNGRFHGLLIDKQRRTAALFNDRYGMHRIYYHESDSAFYFASESKAILAVRPELRRFDSRGLAEFIACGCVLENRTLFPGLQVLPPASCWTFHGGPVPGKASYFQPAEWEEQPDLDPEQFYEALRGVFSGNLARYFQGREPVGMSLTGGLDTRMIMAWHKSAPGSLPCYSFGGMFHECQDVAVARRVAQASGQPHTVIPVAERFLARFSEYAERTVYITDGCVGVDHAADLYVNRIARDIAPVRMTGNYGGEVLRGVRAFRPSVRSPELFAPELSRDFDAAADTYMGIAQAEPVTFAVFRQAPWHHYGLLSLEESQLCLRSPFLDNDFVRTVYTAPASALASEDVCLRLIADGDPRLRQIRTDRGVGGNGSWAAAIRFALNFSFKAEYAYDYGMPHAAARVDHWLKPVHLERLFLGRHKFYHYRVWYRDALREYVREMLLDQRTLARPYLRRATVESIVRRHLDGTHNYTLELHKLLTLELISRLFLD